MTTKERLNESLIFSNLIKPLTIFRLWSHGTAVAAILIVMLQHTQMTSIKRSEFIFQLSLFSWSGKVVCRKMFSCKLAFYQIRKKKQEIVWELPLCLSHNLGSWAWFDFSSYSCLYQANKTVVKYHVYDDMNWKQMSKPGMLLHANKKKTGKMFWSFTCSKDY
jgi:hypothetical protein